MSMICFRKNDNMLRLFLIVFAIWGFMSTEFAMPSMAQSRINPSKTGANKDTTGPKDHPKATKEAMCYIKNFQDSLIGSGVIVSTDGQVITCAHVLRDCGDSFSLFTNDGKELDVEGILDFDLANDWVVLKVKQGENALSPASISDQPIQERMNISKTVFSMGYLSPKQVNWLSAEIRSLDSTGSKFPITRIVHNCTTEGGFSGGGLFGIDSILLGINTDTKEAGKAFPAAIALPIEYININAQTKPIELKCFYEYIKAYDAAELRVDSMQNNAVIGMALNSINGCGGFMQAHLLYAQSLYWAKRCKAAVEECKTIISADSSLDSAHFIMGLSYVEMGQFDSARAVHKKLKTINAGLSDSLFGTISRSVSCIPDVPKRGSGLIVDSASAAASMDSLKQMGIDLDSLPLSWQRLVARFGLDGLKMYKYVYDSRSRPIYLDHELANIGREKLLDILAFMVANGMIPLDPPKGR